ncbi:MAG TPA: hypothetical protein V6D20_13550, partial [Candidatus Obscuribacterales bacterium]
WLDHVDALKQYKDSPPELTSVQSIATFDKAKWLSFKAMMETRLRQSRNPILGTPLIYLVREYDISTREHVQATYDTLDDRLVACVECRGASFIADNQRFFDYLKSLTVDGNLWSFISKFDKARDGRKAWKALLHQAEGPEHVNSRVREAYSQLQDLQYSGTKRRFTLETFIQKHIDAHTILADPANNESVTEQFKIDAFVAGIKDPKCSQILMTTQTAQGMDTFDAFQRKFLDLYNQHIKPKASKETYSVAAMHQGPSEKRGGKRSPARKQQNHKKGGKGPKSKHYPKAEWDKLSEEAKNKIRHERAAAKAARGVSAVTQAPSLDQSISSALETGVTEGKLTHKGQVINFSVGSVQSEDLTEPDITAVAAAVGSKLKGGTQEDLAEARSKSAGGQFGRQN